MFIRDNLMVRTLCLRATKLILISEPYSVDVFEHFHCYPWTNLKKMGYVLFAMSIVSLILQIFMGTLALGE